MNQEPASPPSEPFPHAGPPSQPGHSPPDYLQPEPEQETRILPTPPEEETRILPALPEAATRILPTPTGPSKRAGAHAQSAEAQIVYVEAPTQPGGWRQVGCSILLALTILGCALFSVGGALAGRALVDAGNQFDAATGLVVSFCGAESAQNYAQAYSYFSPAFRKRITLDQYIQRSLTITQKSGAIAQCAIDSTSTPQQAGATFTVNIDVSRSDNSATTGTIYLVANGHGGWLIDNVASPLGLF